MLVAKKKTLWPPGSYLAPSCRASPLYPKTLHHSATTPLKHLHTSSSCRRDHYTRAIQLRQQTYFPALHNFPCGGAQRWLCKWDPPWLRSKLLLSSLARCPSPCPYPACALLVDSWLHCPSSQQGSPVLFPPRLLPMTASPPSSIWITYNPIFWISLELLDILPPCSAPWCSQLLEH